MALYTVFLLLGYRLFFDALENVVRYLLLYQYTKIRSEFL